MSDGNQYHSIAHGVLNALDAQGVVLVVVCAKTGDAASVAIVGGNLAISERLAGMLQHVADRMQLDVARANKAGKS